jgi:uncharacterized protein YraI
MMTLRRTIGLMGLLLVLALPSLAQEGLIASVTGDVSLRVGAGTQWRRVAILPVGTTVALDGRNDDGTWVRGITQNGQVGWMASQFLSISPDQALSLPTMAREAPITVSAPPGGSAPAVAGNPAPVTSRASLSSFSYGGHVANLSEETFNYMRRAGMSWAKVQIKYQRGASPDGVRGIIDTMKGAGFRAFLGVVGEPQAVTEGGYFEDYANYVAGLAALGADAIEVWNEPNIDREWASGSISGAFYTQLLAQAYNAIKRANPATLVISGAPAPTGFFGGCSPAGCDDLPFIQQMAAAGATNYMDCVGMHYNEGIVAPDRRSGDPRVPQFYTRYFPTMVDTYWQAFGGRKPLCFTELGYVTPEGFGFISSGFSWGANTTVAQQAAWLKSAKNISRSGNRVRMMIVWNVDFKRYDDDPMAGYAIVRPDGSCPACDALGR